jgi:2-keto-4-pentenoate hydratase/2-oxohepta-3-ene-1,7-dioic acid hydratase in catechol pathway
MRILRFRTESGKIHTGVREGEAVRDLGVTDPILVRPEDLTTASPVLRYDQLAIEVPLQQVSKIMALAGNYRKHADEAGLAVPTNGIVTPQIFWKPSTTLLRHKGTVVLRKKNVFFDWEAELAVIIGKTARDIAVTEAMAYVFGYSIVNDLSEREYNSEIDGREKRGFDVFFDWLMGKWFDGSAPLGPEIVTADEISDPNNLNIRLLLNGEVMQDSNTKHMIFKIPETIAAISAVMTLEPGDVIAMGTPEGVGFARGRALKPGDHMRAEIEGLGHLDTYVGEQQ